MCIMLHIGMCCLLSLLQADIESEWGSPFQTLEHVFQVSSKAPWLGFAWATDPETGRKKKLTKENKRGLERWLSR